MDILYIILAGVFGFIAGYQVCLHDKDWKKVINDGTGSGN